MNGRRGLQVLVATITLVGLLAHASQAAPVFTGGTGAISFGVTDYGGAPPGVPTFIPNNFTLVNDVLSSPGGTFLNANPVIANNIASYGGVLPGAAFQVGGGNVNGPFGSGAVAISDNQVGFDLSDPFAGGGSASYEIGSWIATYNDATGSAGNYGNYLSIGGSLPAVGSAAAVSLVTEVSSTIPGSPFFGGVALPALVLADAEVGVGVYSWVAVGGTGAAILTDGLTSTFIGLAVNSIPVVIPAGDTFTVTSTLTAYADPAMLFPIETPDQDLLNLTGALPDIVVASTPEPSSIVLAVLAVAILGGVRMVRRKR